LLPHQQIELKLQNVVREILPDADISIVLVRPCPDPKFGDYQSNALMSLAKTRKINPRQLAEKVLAKLDVADVCEKVEIAGAGFLNFRLKNFALENVLQSAARGEHLFFEKFSQPKTIVIDFSSPNVAKPMHVGHIRSTILGDCLARVLKLLGHRVITDNHIGDWGTQFGMLLFGWKYFVEEKKENPSDIETLVNIYRWVQTNIVRESAHSHQDIPPASRADHKSRIELVKLQSGDEENLRIWHEMIALSQKQFEEIYSRLGIKFDHTLGESFYNHWLKKIVDELCEKKIARASEGAVAVFFEEPDLDAIPAIVQKSDGGFNYATTDLATLRYRLQTWHPDEIIYVTDVRQQLHFKQIFAIFRRWHSESKMKLAHVWFGSILGEDGKPFKTRSGETVKLSDLLDEAEARAEKIVLEKNPDLPDAQKKEIARVIGLGAVKYADLLPNRQSDYIFSWDKMLALNGNTAPYLQYAYARIKSIFRKNVGQASSLSPAEKKSETGATPVLLSAPEEVSLAKHLLNFGLTLEAVAEEFRPNFLCNYLFELAEKFSSFYENCPVLKAEEKIRDSRLALCDLTARVLQQGLETLGIETVEQM
jgi:arginyl-tRNA synthetase